MTDTSTARWYFGWNIVAASAVLTMITVGMRMGVGPFFLPMAEDLGFTRSMLAGIVAIGMLCYGLAMPQPVCMQRRPQQWVAVRHMVQLRARRPV